MSFFFLDHGSGNAGGNDEHFVHKCRRPPAGGGGKRRRFFRLMFPEVCAHFESPRQEEHRSTPAGMRTVALSSAVVPPVGRQERGALTSAGSQSRWISEPTQRG